jgi:hypothetical protein
VVPSRVEVIDSHKCERDSTCRGGKCVPCQAGFIQCGNTNCVNPLNDNQNCGDCYKSVSRAACSAQASVSRAQTVSMARVSATVAAAPARQSVTGRAGTPRTTTTTAEDVVKV